jgi:hypothetical protein
MDVFSYIDPGAGSLFFQAALGALLAGSLAVKVFFRDISTRFKQLLSRKTPGTGDLED